MMLIQRGYQPGYMDHSLAEVLNFNVNLSEAKLCLVLELNKAMLVSEFYKACNAMIGCIVVFLFDESLNLP